MREIIKLLRPRQYIKNLFVLAPLLFSFMFTLQSVTSSILAFALFSLIASSIYILNDIMDVNEDQNHPEKKHRPLVSGKVSIKTAKAIFVFLSTATLIITYFVNIDLFFVILFYFVLNILYSIKLKHISILDISIIAVGFVLRLYAGSVVIDSSLSIWIILMTFLLALFLALGKRRDDILLSDMNLKTRKNIDGYNLEFINISMIFMGAVTITSYILYTVSSEVIVELGSQNLYLTSFFVIIGLLRYLQITFVEQKSGNPTQILYQDTFLKTTLALWIISFIIIVNI
ncbi:MAG: UbiA prenyltransferase family protein [uncultured Campylobacterales bacterium]|uniref:UbiA prenyltransferase family protein n=1 Tax=uncultured Campylobacterales bacterium TaxID=352960 RepID=A0A6S6SFQ0_9BACT|nr:MAG: UbiA prenyltransferase family protein [uncultured Campylobacterales bacterium]